MDRELLQFPVPAQIHLVRPILQFERAFRERVQLRAPGFRDAQPRREHQLTRLRQDFDAHAGVRLKGFARFAGLILSAVQSVNETHTHTPPPTFIPQFITEREKENRNFPAPRLD